MSWINDRTAQIAYDAWVRSKESPDVPPTPGQVCYEAYARQRHDGTVLLPWTQMQPPLRLAWEIAAQAVLDAAQAQKEEPC